MQWSSAFSHREELNSTSNSNHQSGRKFLEPLSHQSRHASVHQIQPSPDALISCSCHSRPSRLHIALHCFGVGTLGECGAGWLGDSAYLRGPLSSLGFTSTIFQQVFASGKLEVGVLKTRMIFRTWWNAFRTQE